MVTILQIFAGPKTQKIRCQQERNERFYLHQILTKPNKLWETFIQTSFVVLMKEDGALTSPWYLKES